jgi:predicted metalloendopeptidase
LWFYCKNRNRSVSDRAGRIPILQQAQAEYAKLLGLAGAVMGHELSHAFDDKGHQFDGEGNMRNWWTTEDAQH